jgi:hypothetical protein
MSFLDGLDINTVMYIFLLLLGGLLMLFQMRLMLFPQKRGRIVEFEDLTASSCKECKSRNKGRMSYKIKVQTDEGELVEAEVSPCTMCMDGLKLGSRVGVTKIGTRTVAQSVINLKPERNNVQQGYINN